MYTAVVLDEDCRKLLKYALCNLLDAEGMGYVFQTRQGDELPHHMTLNLDAFDESLNDPSLKGAYCRLEVDGFCFDHDMGVIAARVTKHTAVRNAIDGEWSEQPVNTTNENPHITMCLLGDAKPFHSNKLDWKCGEKYLMLPEFMTVWGHVLECQ